MADISFTILRPVAVPRRFLGAPIMLGASCLSMWMVFAMILFATKDYALMGILCFLAAIPHHFLNYWIGSKEPHVDSLMQVYNQMFRATRVIGRGKVRVYMAG